VDPSSPANADYNSVHLSNVSAALAEMKSPKQIGPYHIVSQIGEGGMGAVYKAQQVEPIERTVALKIIKLGMDTGEVIARFESERQALALMNHTNVARVLDAGATETGRPFFVMEYVEGEPITGFCDRHELTIRQRLELFTQACDAVQHAHQKGIIHRDLKPSNILVSKPENETSSVVKVIDFGLAKAISQRLTEKTLLTETGQLLGTPEYMSPEQADIGFTDIDTRTDVYSLGVILYELLSGARPFHEADFRSGGIVEILRVIRDVDPPRPSTMLRMLDKSGELIARQRHTALETLQRQLRSELEWIPLKALRKDRDERYATAAELAEDIVNYLQSRPLRAGPASTIYRTRKFLRRNKGSVIAAGALLVALIAGAAGTAWQAVRATRAQNGLQVALNQVQQQKSEIETASGKVQAANTNLHAANENLRAVNEFVTGEILQTADPSVTRGEQLTVREALDWAAKGVEKKFKDQPLTEASVQQTLAATYDALGRADLGLPHAQRALELRRKNLGNDDVLTIGAINTLTTLLESQAKLDEAEALCREAVDRAKAYATSQPRLYIAAVSNRARLLQMQGRFDQSAKLADEALDLSQRNFGKDSTESLTAMNNVASLLLLKEDFAGAEKRLRELAAAQRRINGDDHPDTLITGSNLARAIQGKGDLDAAEKLHREVLANMRRVLGDVHPTTLNQVRYLGALLQDREKFADAEDLYRQALKASQKTLGGDHPDTLATMNHLASVLESEGKVDEAIDLDKDVLARCRQRLGDDHPDTLVAMNNLADAYLKKRNVAAAEPLFAELYRRAPSSQLAPPTVALCVSRWGTCLVELGRYQDAIKPLETARQALIDADLKQHRIARLVLLGLALANQETGHADKAEKYKAEWAEWQAGLKREN
jgi:serine/threonine protein kinase